MSNKFSNAVGIGELIFFIELNPFQSVTIFAFYRNQVQLYNKKLQAQASVK